MHVVVDEDRAKVVEPETGRCHCSVKPRMTASEGLTGLGKEHVVNVRTFAPGKLAPERLRKGMRQADSREKMEGSI